MNRALFSSASVEWPTPQAFFGQCALEFGPFDLDACATAENAKARAYYSSEGLTAPWRGVVWCNPPYARGVTGLWVKKGWESAQDGATVVMLLPARTDTRWFHDYCLSGEIRFIRGRLRFGAAKHGAPFPSMLVIFRPTA